jgi:hypothetical protein
MQNKANFQKVKLNVNKVLTRDYDRMDTWSIGKTKPIQSQFKANSKPIKANIMPKQSQFKPNLSCVASGEAGNKPNYCPPSVWRDRANIMLDNVKRPDLDYDKPFNKHASQLFQKRLNCEDTNKAL